MRNPHLGDKRLSATRRTAAGRARECGRGSTRERRAPASRAGLHHDARAASQAQLSRVAETLPRVSRRRRRSCAIAACDHLWLTSHVGGADRAPERRQRRNGEAAKAGADHVLAASWRRTSLPPRPMRAIRESVREARSGGGPRRRARKRRRLKHWRARGSERRAGRRRACTPTTTTTTTRAPTPAHKCSRPRLGRSRAR
jgi:hypothetical protein